MKILIFAKPGAKRASVEKMENLVPGFDAAFSVAVKEPARDGRANRAIEAALAEHLNIPVSSVRIVAGHAARKKIILAHPLGITKEDPSPACRQAGVSNLDM